MSTAIQIRSVDQNLNREFRATLRIGRSPECDICVTGDGSDVVSWEHTRIELVSQGAFLVDLNSSNGTYLNGQRVRESRQLAVGDLLALGQTGPQWEVVSISDLSDMAAKIRRKRAAIGIAALACGIFLVAAYVSNWKIRSAGPVTPSATPREKVPAESERRSSTIDGSQQLSERPVEQDPHLTSTVFSQPTNDAAWNRALDRVRNSLWLLIVEDPKTSISWPLATAVAIDKHRVLTSASIANELAKFRQQGWTLWFQSGRDRSRCAIDDMRELSGYRQETPHRQVYFDLALISTRDVLPEVAMLPQTATLEIGMPLACMYIAHAGEPLNRFDELAAHVSPTKIFAVTALTPQQDGPRILHLRGDVSEFAAGSPVVDAEGTVVGVYSEPAVSTNSSQQQLGVKYAPVVVSDLLQDDTDGLVKWTPVEVMPMAPGKAP